MRLKDTALRWGLVAIVLSTLWYALAAVALRNPGQAWAILAGVESPRNVHFPAIAYTLSVLGYILLPVAIALAVTGLADRSIRRHESSPSSALRDADKALGLN
jgi:hypothetical protein